MIDANDETLIEINGFTAESGTYFSENGATVSFDSETGLFSYSTLPDFNGSDSFTYTGSGNADVRLVITGFGSGVFQGTIDDISVDLIPEPGVSALVGLAGLGLVLRRRRRA